MSDSLSSQSTLFRSCKTPGDRYRKSIPEPVRMGPAQKAVAAQINRDFASAFHAEMLHQIVLGGQPQPLSAAAQAHLAVRTEIEPRFHLADDPVIAVPQF